MSSSNTYITNHLSFSVFHSFYTIFDMTWVNGQMETNPTKRFSWTICLFFGVRFKAQIWHKWTFIFFCHTTNQNQTAHWLFFWCTQRTPLNHFSDSDHVNLYISFVYFYIFSRSYILGMSCRNRFWEEEKTPTQQFTYKHCRLCVCVCSHNISLPMLVTRIVSAFIFYFLVP